MLREITSAPEPEGGTPGAAVRPLSAWQVRRRTELVAFYQRESAGHAIPDLQSRYTPLKARARQALHAFDACIKSQASAAIYAERSAALQAAGQALGEVARPLKAYHQLCRLVRHDHPDAWV